MAARLNRRHQEFVREKIRAGLLINRLEKHVLGDVELSPSQVTAALGLLKKVVADLSAVEHSGEVTHKTVRELTTDELLHIAAGGGARDSAPSGGDEQPSSVH